MDFQSIDSPFLRIKLATIKSKSIIEINVYAYETASSIVNKTFNHQNIIRFHVKHNINVICVFCVITWTVWCLIAFRNYFSPCIRCSFFCTQIENGTTLIFANCVHYSIVLMSFVIFFSRSPSSDSM